MAPQLSPAINMISKPQPQAEAEYSLAFPGASGRGVRVAVIDSGVNPGHPHIGRLAGGVSIGADGEIRDGDYLDLLGHGTAVMAAIQEKAPEADYFAVRLFHDALRAKTSGLLHAIEWAIREKMDVVNLSLGTRNIRFADSFRVLVKQAAAKGVTLVAAREADGEPCLPGSLPEVIGVALDWTLHRHAYRVETTAAGPVFHAAGYPRPIPGMPLERNLHGISFAVANMCGLVVRAREANPASVRDALINNAVTP